MPNSEHDQQGQPTDCINDYDQAMAKIKQLEEELKHKDRALDINLKEQAILRERLMACIKTIRETTGQLNTLESDLKAHYRQIIDRVEDLEQENRDLNLSNDAWSNRSIKLEFEVLSAQEEIKTITLAHDLAINKVSLLEMELKAIKTEKNLQRRHSDKVLSAWGGDFNPSNLM